MTRTHQESYNADEICTALIYFTASAAKCKSSLPTKLLELVKTEPLSYFNRKDREITRISLALELARERCIDLITPGVPGGGDIVPNETDTIFTLAFVARGKNRGQTGTEITFEFNKASKTTKVILKGELEAVEARHLAGLQALGIS